MESLDSKGGRRVMDEIKERYYLRTKWNKKWDEVSKKEFIDAEREAGFYPKGRGRVATAGFIHGSVEGRVDFESVGKEGDEE